MHIIANCAATLDGAIGLPGPRPLRISSPEDMARVHRLRAASDAVLVGVGTVLADDPKLDVKWDLIGQAPRANPLRVVLDRTGRTPADALVLDDRAETLLIHGPDGPTGPGRVLVPVDGDGRIDLAQALRAIAERGVERLLVEGGQAVLTSFLAGRLADEFSVYVAPRVLGLRDAPRIASTDAPLDADLRLRSVDRAGEGVVLSFSRAD